MSLWDLKATVYESVRRLFPFNLVLKAESDNLRELLRNTDPGEKAVLDVGTGTGETLRLLPPQARTYAMDRSLRMLQRAALKGPNHLIAADALAVPFKSGTFDIITAVGMFEYSRDGVSLLREFWRLLRPSGFLILTYSQRNALNLLRLILGHRIYFLRRKELNAFLERSRFVCKTHLKSRIQEQLLLTKT